MIAGLPSEVSTTVGPSDGEGSGGTVVGTGVGLGGSGVSVSKRGITDQSGS